MIYGHKKTIHAAQKLNVEIDKKGNVVAVWFRCCALPFDVTVVDKERADEMTKTSNEANRYTRLNAVDVEQG
jgi:hypothetical protein